MATWASTFKRVIIAFFSMPHAINLLAGMNKRRLDSHEWNQGPLPALAAERPYLTARSG